MPKKVQSNVSSAKKTAKKPGPGRGGRRPGAGRPKGTGKFGCATVAVRVPIHLRDEVLDFAMKKIKKADKDKNKQ